MWGGGGGGGGRACMHGCIFKFDLKYENEVNSLKGHHSRSSCQVLQRILCSLPPKYSMLSLGSQGSLICNHLVLRISKYSMSVELQKAVWQVKASGTKQTRILLCPHGE